MNDFEVFAAVVVVLAALGWAAAERGVIKGRWSWSLEIVPPGKRQPEDKPETAPAVKDAPEAAAGPVEEPVQLHGEAA